MKQETKIKTTMRLLRRGWTTALDSALSGGVLSLSQRCGQLRKDGICVLDKWVYTKGGAKVKAYRIVRPTRWTA